MDARLGNARLYGLLMAGRLLEARATADRLIAYLRERDDDRELTVTLQNATIVDECLEQQQLEELGRPTTRSPTASRAYWSSRGQAAESRARPQLSRSDTRHRCRP